MQNEYSENDYLMWLSCFNNLSVEKKNALLEYFETAREIWFADIEEIKNATTLTDDAIHKIQKTRTSELMEKRLSLLQKNDIRFLGNTNAEFPDYLRNIPQPPVGIYVIGEIPNEYAPRVSIIGARNYTEYGAIVANKIAKELAEQGVVIVSGMARGLDSVAHEGALKGNGKTIAVFGNGVDVCYPRTNESLRRRIIQNGCVMSEYPPKTKPDAHHFPMRNRIISGMSDVLVVVEAKERSGTLITVGHALEQGKDVFAVPGNVTNENSKGTNNLIKQGAYIFTETKDILDILGIENHIDNKINNKKIIQTLATDEKMVYDCISLEPISVDELFIKTNKEINNLLYILTMLEIKGIIKKISGQKYIRS